MDHVREVHTDCQDPHCNYCEGGLFTCDVCGLSEGELTTHCPGVRVGHPTSARCYARVLDYKDGRWIDRRTGTPTDPNAHYPCRHCGALVNPAYGAVAPAKHQERAGTPYDPRAPGDHADCCAVCCYAVYACRYNPRSESC